MLWVNQEEVVGRPQVRHPRILRGSTVRGGNIGGDVTAGLENLLGGEPRGHAELLRDARRQALERSGQVRQTRGSLCQRW